MSATLQCVIVEILSRLPAKSLLRFRCVCKAWRALISDPYFIRKHLSCINPKVSTSYSLLLKKEVFLTIEHEAILNYLSETSNGPLPTRRLHFPVAPDIPFNLFQNLVIGSCNGLICLCLCFMLGDLDAKESYTFVIWNPCTGEFNVLPQPPFLFRELTGVFCKGSNFCGFGYDSTIDDYKVILGSNKSGDEVVVIFTLKTGSWRKVERLDRYFDVYSVGYLVNEALHWVLEDMNEHRVIAKKMVSFDLAEEKFHEIPFPYPLNPLEETVRVGILNNCLTLYFQTEKPRRPKKKRKNLQYPSSFKMWVLRDYGVEESWTEVIIIPTYHEYLYMTCISEKGEVLMTGYHGSLALYNPKEKAFRTVMDDTGYSFRTTPYLHTLVSPLTTTGACGSGKLAQDRESFKSLSSAIEEVQCKGTLRERLAMLKSRFLQFKLEMDLENGSSSSCSSILASDQKFEQDKKDSLNNGVS